MSVMDMSFPDRADIIAEVQAQLMPGGLPMSTYLSLEADSQLPPADAAALRDQILLNLEVRLRHAEHVGGIA